MSRPEIAAPPSVLAVREGRDRLIGIALAAGAVIAFSFRPILVKLAYTYVEDPVTLLALRMVFALPFFLAAALWAGRDAALPRLSPGEIAAMAGLGFLGYYLASFLDFLGLQYVSAGVGRLLLFLYPTIVVLLSAAFLGKRIRLGDVGALLLTYVGVALVLSTALGGSQPNLPLGAVFVFGGAVTYAIYLTAGSHLVRRVGSMRFSAYALAAASIVAIVQFLALRPISALHLPGHVYAIMITMAVFCTVIPVFMTAEALRRIGANHVAMIGALGPVSVIVVSYFGLDEVMTPLQLCGAVLVVLGVVMVSAQRTR